MGSSELMLAKQIIGRYPEVFEALITFEKTKKIPKIYRRKRINITIDENVLREFKGYCRGKNINMSRFAENRMIEAMKE
jgi:hypothetical protein